MSTPPDDLGVTPLYLACANGSQTMAAKLLAAGAHANIAATITGETALTGGFTYGCH